MSFAPPYANPRGLILLLPIAFLLACAPSQSVTSSSQSPVRVLKGSPTNQGLELEGRFVGGSYAMSDPDEYLIIAGHTYGLSGLRGQTLPNGIKQVQATLINNSRATIKLQYRFQFFDEAGFQLEAEKYPWLRIQIPAGNQAPVTGTSYSGRAASFRIYVRS